MSGTLLTGPIPSFSKTIRGYRAVSTRVGDTLQRIAMRELGDAAQWYDLASLNTLVPPYLTDDPAKVSTGVKLAGKDTILVPSTAPAPTGVAQAPSVFGSDCLLQNRQLQATATGDFAVLSEDSNLKQALEMRIATRPGELVYHKDYGCKVYTLIGKGNTPVADRLAAAFVAQAVSSDPRIDRAENTTATTTGDVLACASTAVAVNGKRLPVGVGGNAS